MNANAAVPTPNFHDIGRLLAALETRFTQMKLISIQEDDLGKAIFIKKKALVVVGKLKAMRTLTVDTITAELQPYDTLIDKDLKESLSSWVQEKSIEGEKFWRC